MVKSELIKRLSEISCISSIQATLIVDHFFRTIFNNLSYGRRIEIRGFGNLNIREYGSYTGRNPKTGENIRVSEKKLPFFKVGKDLYDRVNQSQT